MKNIKKGVGKVAAVGLISILSLSGLSSAAFAAGEEFPNPQEYKESMTVGGELTVVNQEDTNNDGLINEGDVLSLNLHIENTSDTDYNYVDVSSKGLDLNRSLVSESLSAGESVDFSFAYTVKAGDEYAGNVSHNVFVNVRDETRIENTTEFEFTEYVNMDENVIYTSNSKLSGLIMDKDTGKIYVYSRDDYDNYYGIDESRLEEGYHPTSAGDGFVHAFDFTNDTEETITLNGMEFVDSIIEENVSGTVVEPGETVNLYVISEITRDDLDWGLINSKATVGGDFNVVLSDTNGNMYLIVSGSTTTQGTNLSLNANGDTTIENQGLTADANIDYTFSAAEGAGTIVVDGVSSETFGFIESNHVLTNTDEVIVEAPEAIVLESEESFEERAFVVYRGLYHSMNLEINTIEVYGSYGSGSGGGRGDEFPIPTLTDPVCGEEAQPVLPSLDEYNEERDDITGFVEWLVEREDNVYNIYVVDYAYPMIMDEHQLEIPAVVECPVVEIPAPEVPVFVPETCDSDSSVNLPENSEFYTYEQSVIDGVHTVNAILVETGEIAETWSFDVIEATDCVVDPPVVEIPDYEVPTFVPGTCDTDYELNVPENTEHYNYFSSSVYAYNVPTAVFGVQVYSNETDEMLDSWTFEYVLPTGCDPVEEETPEPPVEEVVPPVVEEKPEPPVKEVPKKVNSGEVSEIVVEDNNVAVFALIAGAGVAVALTTGIVLVRSRKK